MNATPRRGWRETVEAGLYRAHRVACPSSRDRRAGRRCGCPFQIQVPGEQPGSTRFLTVAGTIGDARAERRRLLAAGRPEPRPQPPRGAAADGTLDDFAGHYLAAKAPRLSPATIRNREDDYLRRISPTLGGLTLAKVTRERVEVWLAGLATTATSHRMVVQTVATLRAILGAAVDWGRIPDNPAARLRLPAPNPEAHRSVERVVTAHQMEELFAAAGSLRTETILRACGQAGLRRSEVIGLKWPDLDLAARRIDVRRGVVQERATRNRPMRKVETPTKGRRAGRVAIPDILAERLADWYAVSVIEGGGDAASHVWPGRAGGPMHDRSVAQALERACHRAGLVDDDGRPLVTPHGLRHSYASILLAAGVPLIVVSRQLRHADPKITATTYAHLLHDGQLDAAARAVQDAAEASLPPARRTGREHRTTRSPK